MDPMERVVKAQIAGLKGRQRMRPIRASERSPQGDLDRAIDEAVGFYEGVEEAMPEAFHVLIAVGRNLLANGAEPDYEAAGEQLKLTPEHLLSDADVAEWTHAIVDAAIGDRLLVDHPEDSNDG